MTTLYIANTTKQHHDFTMRRPESQHPTVIKIPAGTQAIVVNDGGRDLVDSVIAQHRAYGLVSAEEAAKAKRFVGLCYGIDKEVSFKGMKVVFDNNDDFLEKQGVEQVKQVAAAANASIDAHLEQAGIPNDAAHVEVQVVEENEPSVGTTMNVGVEVVKENQQPRHESGGGRRGGRGR